ncbi:hypothetical protein [Clostridium perfringens]|uniref:hypothetical protein n=1 Tax=Clostridium perfringens TaxID=1502 RepID=UPI00096AC4E9|nr:hypothetical protein [Clostridium perfringens]
MYTLDVFRDDDARVYCIGTNVKNPDKVAMNIKMNYNLAPCNVLGGSSTYETNMRCGKNYNLIITEFDERNIPALEEMMQEAIQLFDN